MDKQMKDIFCKQVDAELDKISKMPSLNDVTLSNLYKLTDIKKNLLKIEKLENEMMNGGMMGGSYGYSYGGQGGGNSNGMMPYYGNSYGGQGSGNSNGMMPYYGNSYAGGNSNGYSRGDSMSHLEAAMRDARNEQEREEIRQLMARYYS